MSRNATSFKIQESVTAKVFIYYFIKENHLELDEKSGALSVVKPYDDTGLFNFYIEVGKILH